MSSQTPRIKRRDLRAAARPDTLTSTRAKLIEAAGEVFAEVGYEAATVREICARAGANVAAVNYYFGDKLGLYTEVLRSLSAVDAVRKALNSEGSPEEILRRAIKGMLENLCREDQQALRFRLIMHELGKPTPALSRVIDETIRPLFSRLRELVGAILNLPPDHPKTRFCTLSIVGQIIHYKHGRPILARLWPELKMTPEQVEQIANHIAEFSLAYLHSAGSASDGMAATRGAKGRR
ncbi:MAG: CerR family C-terminal domain-containing protein [Blastocatellia bacterium]|nr:CerR family C-terminal domain-containing protein [Blastocatellia bacterium]